MVLADCIYLFLSKQSRVILRNATAMALFRMERKYICGEAFVYLEVDE